VRVDGPAVLARIRRLRDRFVESVFEGIDAFPDETRLTGRAVFEGPDALRIDDHTRLRFKAAVLATGSSPSVPEPLKGLGDRVLTTDTVFEIEDLPASLAVLGAGPVGLERCGDQRVRSRRQSRRLARSRSEAGRPRDLFGGLRSASRREGRER
jgi:dihydrolipoamide dehydrogenase